MLRDLQPAESKRRARVLSQLGYASLLLALAVLATTTWIVYSNWTQAVRNANVASSNRKYLRSLNNILGDLKDAETGQRGFILTGEERYLKPYTEVLEPIKQNLRVLSEVAKERPDQKKAIEEIQSLTVVKLDELADTIRLRRQKGGFEAALAVVLTDRGMEAMNEIKAECSRISDQQTADTARRSDQARKRQSRAIEIAASGGLILFCLMVAGVVVVNSGADRQAQLSERLADSRQIFETTLTSIGDGVVATDTTGRITFMNPTAAQLTGWSRTDAVGKQLDDVFPLLNETSRTKVQSPFDKVVRTGSVVGLANHTILVRKDGSEIPIDDSGAPIRNVHGELCGVVLVFRGVEERRKAEADLRQSHNELLKANEELRQFSYAATHDLQEPLRTIVVFSQLLSRHYKELLDERGQQMVRTVEEAGSRMSALITDLLAFSRVGGENSAADRVATNAEEILQDTLVQLKGAIEETQAVITHNELPHVWSEPAQLSQVFQNLISNAIKYRKPGVAPVIDVSSAIEGDHATFQISDNGMGFNQEYSDRIFLLFQRLHGRSIPGTGIGLALCRRIVERQGGRIWVRSEENAGSTFFFTLPLAESPVATSKQLVSH